MKKILPAHLHLNIADSEFQQRDSHCHELEMARSAPLPKLPNCSSFSSAYWSFWMLKYLKRIIFLLHKHTEYENQVPGLRWLKKLRTWNTSKARANGLNKHVRAVSSSLLGIVGRMPRTRKGRKADSSSEVYYFAFSVFISWDRPWLKHCDFLLHPVFSFSSNLLILLRVRIRCHLPLAARRVSTSRPKTWRIFCLKYWLVGLGRIQDLDHFNTGRVQERKSGLERWLCSLEH